MTDTIDDVAAEAAGHEPVEPAFDRQGVPEQLVAQARDKGIELVGPNGLLSQLTKRVLETPPRAAQDDSPQAQVVKQAAWRAAVSGIVSHQAARDPPISGAAQGSTSSRPRWRCT
jgi:hypothetical protein